MKYFMLLAFLEVYFHGKFVLEYIFCTSEIIHVGLLTSMALAIIQLRLFLVLMDIQVHLLV